MPVTTENDVLARCA